MSSSRRQFIYNSSIFLAGSTVFSGVFSSRSLHAKTPLGFWRPLQLGSSTSGTMELWNWGPTGYLANNGAPASASTPVQVGSMGDWLQISGGRNFGAAVKSDGTLWAWGNNALGQLGNGTRTSNSSPIQIGSNTDWKFVNAAFDCTYAIKADGSLWSWGGNTSGQLGSNSVSSRSSPVQVGAETTWVSVTGSELFVHALRANGTLWAWGNGAGFILGNGSSTSRSAPIQVGSATNRVQVESDRSHVSGIQADGSLWTWGSGTDYRHGLGATTATISTPVRIGALNTWVYLSCGGSHSAAIQADGSLWSWGANASGQLGIGNTSTCSTPVRVGTDNDWAQVVCYGENPNLSTVGLKTDGSLWAWGYNTDRRLGIGTATNVSTPVRIGTSNHWLTMSSMEYFVVAIKARE